ncbi:unnamed protein product, partial [Hapterophycus canaliculatus]
FALSHADLRVFFSRPLGGAGRRTGEAIRSLQAATTTHPFVLSAHAPPVGKIAEQPRRGCHPRRRGWSDFRPFPSSRSLRAWTLVCSFEESKPSSLTRRPVFLFVPTSMWLLTRVRWWRGGGYDRKLTGNFALGVSSTLCLFYLPNI